MHCTVLVLVAQIPASIVTLSRGAYQLQSFPYTFCAGASEEDGAVPFHAVIASRWVAVPPSTPGAVLVLQGGS